MLAQTMRAARFHAATRTLAIESIPVPEPGRIDVRVRVDACGICGSDLSLVAGHLAPSLDVVTPGHEAAGTIDAVGADVPPDWTVGRRVVLAPGRACGECRACRRGAQLGCEHPQILGFDRDGGFAEFVVVPFHALVAIPDQLPAEQWAVLADAVSTPYAALVDTGEMRPADAVGIWGIGGLGVHAVQVARALGAAPIVAVDPRPSARARALALGADVALDPADPAFAEQMRAASGGDGLTIALDIVGSTSTIQQSLASIGRDGRVVVVGVTGDALTLGSVGKFVVRGRDLRGHLGYQRRHLEQLVRLVECGRLSFRDSISGIVTLDELGAAIDRLRSRVADEVRVFVRPAASEQ